MKRREDKTWIMIVAVLAGVVAVVAAVWWADRLLARREKPLIQGTVECATYRAASKIAGRIDSLTVREGDRVRKGDPLYRLSVPEVEARLAGAEAARSAAEAMDRKVLAGARVQQLQAAEQLWRKAQAGRTLAEQTFGRVRNLYEEGVVAAQRYDEARANLDAAQATEQAARAEYRLVRAGADREERAAAAAGVGQADAAVTGVEVYMRDASVYAPASGEVETVALREGELAGVGMPVVTILDLADLWVVFNLKESLMPGIVPGSRMRGYVPALGRDVRLEVYWIAAEADFAVWDATRTRGGFDLRTFAVKARPAEGAGGLRPGMSVVVDWASVERASVGPAPAKCASAKR